MRHEKGQRRNGVQSCCMDRVHGDMIAQEKAVREKQICYGNKLSK